MIARSEKVTSTPAAVEVIPAAASTVRVPALKLPLVKLMVSEGVVSAQPLTPLIVTTTEKTVPATTLLLGIVLKAKEAPPSTVIVADDV